jgi:hypothetical protein
MMNDTMVMKREITLHKGTSELLWEAMRRLKKSHGDTDLLGLGYHSGYAPALLDGVMEYAITEHRGHLCWFKLTAFGEIVVNTVFGLGIEPENVEDMDSRFPEVIYIEHAV